MSSEISPLGRFALAEASTAAHLFETYAVGVELSGIQFDAHRGQRAAADR